MFIVPSVPMCISSYKRDHPLINLVNLKLTSNRGLNSSLYWICNDHRLWRVSMEVVIRYVPCYDLALLINEFTS
jgi:hypothetical protein